MAFSVKIKQESVDKFKGELAKAFSRVIGSTQMLNEIGETIVADIRDNTQNKGKGFDSTGNIIDLPLLKENTIFNREYLGKYNRKKQEERFESGFANNTLSGQLLRSLKHLILGPGKIQIDVDGKRSPYLSGLGNPISKNVPDNKTVRDYLVALGRGFIGVRPTVKRSINRIVKKFVKRSLAVSRLTKQ